MRKNSQEYWESYWQQGHLTSFGETFSGNYTGILATIWLDYFNGAVPHTNVLDIGTGAGALLDICLTSSTEFSNITGIDSANVMASKSILRTPNAKILDGVDAKSIPLPSTSIDYVVSQFGIEYSNLSESMPEVARLLTSQGQFQFVVHHVDSIIIKGNKPALNAADALLKSDGAFSSLKVLVNNMRKYGIQSRKTDNSGQKFNKAIDNLVTTVGQKAVFDTNFPQLTNLVTQEANYNVADKMMASFKDELYGQRSRLNELVKAAFDVQKMRQFSALCEQLELSITSQDYIHDESTKVLAYKITGHRKKK